MGRLGSTLKRGSVALLVAVVALLAACSSGAGSVPQPTFEGGPRLQVDRDTWEFGEVPVGEMVEAVFQMRNVGGSPLLIEEAMTRVLEGCCPPMPELEADEIPPGQSRTLALRFTMGSGMGGPHTFQVVVRSNDPVEPEAHLTVRGTFRE